MSDQNIPKGTYSMTEIQKAIDIYVAIQAMIANDEADVCFRFDDENLVCISWQAPRVRA